MAGALTIRRATLEDLPAIGAIYDDAVLKTTATFDTEPRTAERHRLWFEAHKEPKHPVLAAESGGRVIGWASLSSWSDRCAYDETAEDSIYIAEEARGRGAGKALLAELLAQGRAAGLRTVLARITGESEASIRLHESFGFVRVGVMRQVGRKFGRLLDVSMYQLLWP
jgi:phosphinothricin acetyltransferase